MLGVNQQCVGYYGNAVVAAWECGGTVVVDLLSLFA
jgi:hypothetical protein